MRNVMRKLVAIFFGSATAALAAEGASVSGMSPLAVLFIAFFALVLAFQSIPALVMLFSSLKGIFSHSAHRDHEVSETEKSL